MAERRGSPRVNFTGITLLYTEQSELPCLARDLSESGILVLPQRQAVISTGQLLHLAFTLPEAEQWINLEGTVVRRAKLNQRVALGVQFERVPPSVRKELRSFIQDYEPKLVLPPPLPPDVKLKTLRPAAVPARKNQKKRESTERERRRPLEIGRTAREEFTEALIEDDDTFRTPEAEQQRLLDSTKADEKEEQETNLTPREVFARLLEEEPEPEPARYIDKGEDTAVMAEEDLFVLKVESIKPRETED
jgi:hypothetical protein